MRGQRQFIGRQSLYGSDAKSRKKAQDRLSVLEQGTAGKKYVLCSLGDCSYDIHRLCRKPQTCAEGLNLDYHLGLLGHSDADVVLHAVCDALLYAAALR